MKMQLRITGPNGVVDTDELVEIKPSTKIEIDLSLRPPDEHGVELRFKTPGEPGKTYELYAEDYVELGDLFE